MKHYGLGVIYIIINNGSWAIEWPYFENTTQKYIKNSKDTQFIDIDAPRMDFATIAKGFNVDSYTVKTTDELAIAFQKAIKTAKNGGPSLIDIILPEFKPD